MRSWSFALLLLVMTVACEEPAPTAKHYPLLVRAASEDGEPMADLPIVSNSTVLGKTDVDGVLLVDVQGQEGLDMTFSPRCPVGSRALGTPPSLKLRTLGSGARPELEVSCGRDKRTAALLVSAPGYPGLPVLVHDREVGRTDASGTAHVLLTGDPSTPMRVVLDTHTLPAVMPASPHRDLQIGSRDDIVVFAPELTLKKAERKKVARVKKVAPPKIMRPEKLR